MLKIEHMGAIVFRDLIWHFPGKENELFLTFDDGPEPEITPWVLSELKKYNAKATFFCVGNKVEKNPSLYNQILAEGHSVGNHTYSHIKGWTTASENYVSDVDKAKEFIQSKLFRPPYGRIRPHQLKILKKDFKIVMWDVLSKDYDPKTTNEQCFNNVTDYAESGSIIVFHDNIKSQNNLFYALPKVLEYYSDQGFVFNSISF
ncbi:MAG: polysaccharide deacetylase family protein [Bacteroidales bacterium]|nr:polysaccharide deacetylase family protein [Bacteroidales bacterium]